MHLEGSRNISISVEKNSADITRFVESEVQRLISKRLLLDGKVTKNLKGRMLETLINGAQGMFRWVEMSLEALSRIKYAPDFKNALGQLPNKLSGLYDIIYTQIDQTETYGRYVAVNTLKWLLCAQRLLSTEELLAAVHAVDAGADSDSDEDDDSGEAGSPENDVLRLCRNLVVIDSEERTFRFAHQSVREYLLGKSEYTIIRQHALATERCLDVYLTEPSPGPRVSRSVLQNDILKHYAGAYWPVHYTYIVECDFPETHEKVSRFLMEGTRTSHYYIQWASSIRSNDDEEGYPTLNRALGLVRGDPLGLRLCSSIITPETYRSLACAFGFSKFLKEPALSTLEVNQRHKFETFDYTLLVVATECGHDQIVQLLLDQGADLNAESGKFDNAFGTAVYKRHDHLVQVLLDNGADVNAQGGEYGNALQAASFSGCEEIVQTLLDKGSDVNAHGGYYGNALQAASYRGHHKVVRLLLNHNAVVNWKDRQGRTAFHLASAGGQVETVETLLSFGSDPTTVDKQGRNALHHAASNGNVGMVYWLLKKGFDPNCTDRDGWSSLHWAAKSDSVNITKVLKTAGARSTVEIIEGWTPQAVANLHRKDHLSRSRENAESKLVGKQSIASLAAALESIVNGHEVTPGISQNGYICDGCELVSFVLNKHVESFI